ncbi:protein of unknown function [Streptococcus thermophilus]|nr:protein of unknown function [Streptococcus thermophilus]
MLITFLGIPEKFYYIFYFLQGFYACGKIFEKVRNNEL